MKIKIKELKLEFDIYLSKYKGKKVLLQFPDGLKPYSKKISNIFQENNIDHALYLGPSFGACDIPLGMKEFDHILHFGHNKFVR